MLATLALIIRLNAVRCRLPALVPGGRGHPLVRCPAVLAPGTHRDPDDYSTPKARIDALERQAWSRAWRMLGAGPRWVERWRSRGRCSRRSVWALAAWPLVALRFHTDRADRHPDQHPLDLPLTIAGAPAALGLTLGSVAGDLVPPGHGRWPFPALCGLTLRWTDVDRSVGQRISSLGPCLRARAGAWAPGRSCSMGFYALIAASGWPGRFARGRRARLGLWAAYGWRSGRTFLAIAPR